MSATNDCSNLTVLISVITQFHFKNGTNLLVSVVHLLLGDIFRLKHTNLDFLNKSLKKVHLLGSTSEPNIHFSCTLGISDLSEL